MNAKKLFLYAAMAMILGAGVHHAFAADNGKATGVPPLIDLKSEAKEQALKDSKLQGAPNSEVISVTAAEEKPAEKPKPKPKPEKPKNPHWQYSGKEGPDHWGDLSENYATCKTGKNQSPINLMDQMAVGTTNLPGFDVFYRESYLKIVNDGHSVQVNYPLGSYIKINGHRYELLQFHFHTPSEHQINGFNYPMEMQLVHKDGFDNLAVIGIIFQEGETNEALEGIVQNLPTELKKTEIHKEVNIDPRNFFPENKQFFKYSGSLTTPPCSEGVYWIVFKQPIQASAEQIQKMNEAMGDNARPVQKLNSRSLLKSWSDASQDTIDYEFYY